MNDMGIDVKSSCSELFTPVHQVMEILPEICLCGNNTGTLACRGQLWNGQCTAIVLTQYPAALVYTHWRRSSSSEITSSHYIFLKQLLVYPMFQITGRREIIWGHFDFSPKRIPWLLYFGKSGHSCYCDPFFFFLNYVSNIMRYVKGDIR